MGGRDCCGTQHPNVYAKVSGLNTAADPDTWTTDYLKSYINYALKLARIA
jgi:L-fuconolactonase